MPAKDEAISKITNEVELRLADWYGIGTQLVSPAPQLRILRRSFLVRYKIRSPGNMLSSLLIKIPKGGDSNHLDDALMHQKPRDSVRMEYDTLVACADIFRPENTTFSAVRPLAFFPEWNAIAMEGLVAQPLTVLRFRSPGFNQLLHRIGSWLRIFHDRIGNMEMEFLDGEHLRLEIVSHLQKLQATATFRIENLGSLQESFERHVDSLHHTTVPVAHLHGDFKCNNILITPDGRVAAVDTKLRVRGPIYSDLAKLIVDLLSQKFMLLTYGLPARPTKWRSSILNGYFAGSPYENHVLDFYCALAVVQKWTIDEYVLRRMNRRSRLFTSYMRRYFKKLLQNYFSASFS